MMDEQHKAYHDLRRDIIQEVADSLPPGATGEQAVIAIQWRLNEGLPKLVELEIDIGQEVNVPIPIGLAQLTMIAIEEYLAARHLLDETHDALHDLKRDIDSRVEARILRSVKEVL